MSERRTAANRSNATRSTGPRTAGGKARSATNATRHGLTSNMPHSEEAIAWIFQIATELMDGQHDLMPLSLESAALFYRMEQIQSVRMQLWARCLSELPSDTDGLPIEVREALATAAHLPQLLRLEAYERRNLSKLKKCLAKLERLTSRSAGSPPSTHTPSRSPPDASE